MSKAPDIRQVLVHAAVWPYLELWLASHGLVLGRVPVEDDLPTYAMTPADPGDAEKVLAATVRDAARQSTPHACDNCDGIDPASCLANPDRASRQTTGQDDTEPDPTTADDPTPLRWGLGDVLHGDDNTVIVCLSGPNREPYWLELDAERAAALRDDLAPPTADCPACQVGIEHTAHCPSPETHNWGCGCPTDQHPAPAVGQPAEAHDTEARPPATSWRTESIETDGFETTWTVEDER
ncbi:hypothetical protein ACFU8I_02750 [Streptomyces sp. NPDC057540]|uniref:hypothetical protein n=1 Tax=Streptomyces sp. NPDC057540 TaxID=3346160 RepID=UPI003683C199